VPRTLTSPAANSALRFSILAAILVAVVACTSEERVIPGAGQTPNAPDPTTTDGTTDSADPGPSNDGADDPAEPTPDAPSEPMSAPLIDQPVAVSARNGSYELMLESATSTVLEGASAVVLSLTLDREPRFNAHVRLAAAFNDAPNTLPFVIEWDDSRLVGQELNTSLRVSLAIGAMPLQPQTHTLTVTASDSANEPVVIQLDLNIAPTARPDVYLLAGQSNMVGFSALNARDDAPGGLDEPNARIQQLNVTGNDRSNFSSTARFTDPTNQVGSPRFTEALDALHDGFDTRLGGKANTMIGLGLSFAKRALANTTANIILVPAAWPDTGFCKRSSNALPGSGWNASAQQSDAFAGTLLYERALLRTNIALNESGGILRGILWHQGEADSDDAECAIAYRDNLMDLIQALRTNIEIDARVAPFHAEKNLVDSAQRTISTVVDYAATVNNDDLVPPQYPCGEGSCVHFGATAYREMGTRYYDQLRSLFP